MHGEVVDAEALGLIVERVEEGDVDLSMAPFDREPVLLADERVMRFGLVRRLADAVGVPRATLLLLTEHPVQLSSEELELLADLEALARPERQPSAKGGAPPPTFDDPFDLDSVAALENINDVFFALDAEFTIVYANRRFLEVTGKTRAELVGHNLVDVYPTMRGTHVLMAYQEVMRSGEAMAFEGHWPEIGKTFSVRVSPSVDGVAIYATDVSAQRSREAELSASEERFRLLSRVTNDVIYDWDLVAGTLWWNHGYEALTGYTYDAPQCGLDSWAALLHPDDAETVIASLEAALVDDSEQWSSTYRIRDRDGRVLEVFDRGFIVRDAEGNAIRMIGGVTDETERRLFDRQLLRAQRMETVGRLTGGIAHDINNILAPILITTSVLLDEAGGEAVCVDFDDLELIRSSAQRGAKMIDRLLTFARGGGEELVPIRIGPVIREVQQIIEETFPKTIEVIGEPIDDCLHITSDPTLIHQILTNLAINSSDAMPDGGRIWIRVYPVEGGAMPADTIGASPATDFVAIELQDTGTGMASEVVERAFEPFYTTKDIGQGTGLGLATTLSIVETHDGLVRVDSAPGRGTTVTVYLPATGEAARASRSSCRRDFAGDGEHLLVVDDEPNIVSAAAKALERRGFRVSRAPSAPKALEILASCDDVALVLSDLMMPEMSGVELVRAIRARHGDLPVVVWTGVASAPIADDARSAGAAQVLPKPFSISELMAAVESILVD